MNQSSTPKYSLRGLGLLLVWVLAFCALCGIFYGLTVFFLWGAVTLGYTPAHGIVALFSIGPVMFVFFRLWELSSSIAADLSGKRVDAGTGVASNCAVAKGER
jgi:hypothetical protein